ncbi:MAG: hypothetical protein AAF125_08800 [Chloroflexota bacterium]
MSTETTTRRTPLLIGAVGLAVIVALVVGSRLLQGTPPMEIISFEVAPAEVVYNVRTPVTLTVSVANATSVQVTGIEDISSSPESVTEQTVLTTVPFTVTLTATDAAGEMLSQQLTVGIIPARCSASAETPLLFPNMGLPMGNLFPGESITIRGKLPGLNAWLAAETPEGDPARVSMNDVTCEGFDPADMGPPPP